MNFTLHPELITFVGVDITNIKSRTEKKVWGQDSTRAWKRLAKHFMGIPDYLYRSLQLIIHVKFISYGERNDTLNPFQWIQAKMNLSGDESYTPKLTWVMKMRSDGHLASEVFIYVDYGSTIAH